MGDRLGQVECLDGLAELAATAGHPLLGTKIYGAATFHRTQFGAPVRPVGRVRRAAVIARQRAVLTDLQFESAWAAGEALSLEAAAAEAAAFARTLQDGTGDRPDSTASGAALTARELQVLHLVAARLTDQEIADVLAVSPRTVSTHVSNILGKLGVRSRRKAVAEAVRRGIVEPSV
jgi:DNA-binding CsgD family transcriptional regulator